MKKLYYGGDISNMEAENDVAEAVLVDNGVIEKVGCLDDFRAS